MLAELQRLTVLALREPDPVAFLRRAAMDPSHALGDEERRWLASASADGLSMSRMLVRKLRMQRLLRGAPEVAARLEQDPEGFAARFRDWDAATPWTAVFPRDEAALWRGTRGDV